MKERITQERIMKEELLAEIVGGGRTDINIRGYKYKIIIREDVEEVILTPYGIGCSASSDVDMESYNYRNSGKVYAVALEVAHEIMDAIRKIWAEASDIA